MPFDSDAEESEGSLLGPQPTSDDDFPMEGDDNGDSLDESIPPLPTPMPPLHPIQVSSYNVIRCLMHWTLSNYFYSLIMMRN